jgi:hypothetical protein
VATGPRSLRNSAPAIFVTTFIYDREVRLGELENKESPTKTDARGIRLLEIETLNAMWAIKIRGC